MRIRAFLPILLLASPLAAEEKTPPAPQPLPSSIDGLPIGALPKQELPATGCAAYFWSTSTTRVLVAMATAEPAQLRLSIGGTITDLPRTAQHGEGGFGFAGETEYHGGDVTAVLDMTIETRSDLKDGAAVPDATLRLDRTGQDSIALPVKGIIGCA